MDIDIIEGDLSGTECIDNLDISGSFPLDDQLLNFALTDCNGSGSSVDLDVYLGNNISEPKNEDTVVEKDEVIDGDYVFNKEEITDNEGYSLVFNEPVHSAVEMAIIQNEIINEIDRKENVIPSIAVEPCYSEVNDMVKTHKYNFRPRKTIPIYTDTPQISDNKRKGAKRTQQRVITYYKFDPSPVFTGRGLAILRPKKIEYIKVSPPSSPQLILALSPNQLDDFIYPPHKIVKRRVRYPKEELECYICPYVSTVLFAMKRHFMEHKLHGITIPLKYSCEICGQDAESQLENKYHMAKSHVVHGNLYCCDTCPFKTDQLKKLIQHRRKHTGEKPHHCPQCPYRSTRRDNLHSHGRRCHGLPRMDRDTFTQPILDWDTIIKATDANNNALFEVN